MRKIISIWAAGIMVTIAFSGVASESEYSPQSFTEAPACDGGFHEVLQPFGWDGANIIVGNGALTVDIREDTGLCTLSWPYPSNYDQLDYISFDILDGTIDLIPEGRPYRRNMGSFLGVKTNGTVSWLTDDSWQCHQQYLSNETAVAVTRSENREWGIIVETTDLVTINSDILVRNFKVTNIGPTRQIELVYYENLNPTMRENKFDLIRSTINEEKYDYAVEYNQDGDYLLHYNPGEGSTESVYFAIGSLNKSSRHNCGVEHTSSDALTVENKGEEYCADSAKGKVNAALAFDLGSVPDGATRELPIYFAVDSTSDGAVELLNNARGKPFQSHLDETNAYWNEWICRASLSKITCPLVKNVVKRGLITIKLHQSKETGGTVASPCRQTPYNYCWPRDTWPMVLALDRLGYTDEAEKAIEFFKMSQKADGHWSVNAWCDGRATDDDTYAVEATAILVIAPYEHYGYTGDIDWLESMWPMMKKAADWVRGRRDPITHVQSTSNEGDYFIPCESILGAACAYRAMRVASEVAQLLGYGDDQSIPLWDARADEIERSIDPVFWLESEKRYAEFVNFPVIGLDGSLHIRLELMAILKNALGNPSKGLPELLNYLSSHAESIRGLFDQDGPGTALLRNTEYSGYNGPVVTWISEPTGMLAHNDPRVVTSANAAWEFYSDAILNPRKVWEGITLTLYSGEVWTYPLAWTNYYFAAAGQSDDLSHARSELMIKFMAENLHDTLLIPDAFAMQKGRWAPVASPSITLSTSWYIASVLNNYGI